MAKEIRLVGPAQGYFHAWNYIGRFIADGRLILSWRVAARPHWIAVKIIKETLDLDWMSPLDGDLPTAVLYGAVLTVVHTASFIPWDVVRKRLKEAVGGAPEERRVWRGVEMRWPTGKVPMAVRLTRRRIRITALSRWTPARLGRLLRALAKVPNTGPVHLHAEVERIDTGESHSHARRRPGWMNTSARFEP